MAHYNLNSKITSKGQTTVPKQVRDMLGLNEGAEMVWVVSDGVATVRPRTRRVEEFAGLLGTPPKGQPLAVEDMGKAVGQAIIAEFEGDKQ